MSVIDQVVHQLRDGEWHALQNLAKTLDLTQPKLRKIIQFLQDLELIRRDKKQRIRIKPDLKPLTTPEKSG